jgi:hypothetical protein
MASLHKFPAISADSYEVRMQLEFRSVREASWINGTKLHIVVHIQNDDLHIAELRPLAYRINRHMADEKLDAKAIAGFQMNIIQFMESALGPNVRSFI